MYTNFKSLFNPNVDSNEYYREFIESLVKKDGTTTFPNKSQFRPVTYTKDGLTFTFEPSAVYEQFNTKVQTVQATIAFYANKFEETQGVAGNNFPANVMESLREQLNEVFTFMHEYFGLPLYNGKRNLNYIIIAIREDIVKDKRVQTETFAHKQKTVNKRATQNAILKALNMRAYGATSEEIKQAFQIKSK